MAEKNTENSDAKENKEPVNNSPQTVIIPKTNWWMILCLVLITALLAVGGMYFLLRPQLKTEFLSEKIEESVRPTIKTEEQKPTSEVTQIQPTKTTVTKSELIPIDDVWNKYINPGLGFSLKVLKKMLEPYGECYYNTANGDKSYRPKEAIVPVKIFEEGTNVYIAAEYLYRLNGETKENSKTLYSGCDKTVNTPLIIKDREKYYSPNWNIRINTVANDAELDKFLKERYGIGCSLGEKKETKQTGVYDIEINGDGKDLSETACPLNYMTVVKYYPAKQKVASWDIGQACNFSYPTYDTCRDTEMTDSFTFE